VFARLIKDIAPPDLAVDVVVPDASPRGEVLASPPAAGAVAAVTAAPVAEVNPYAAELARAVPAASAAPSTAFGLPQLDPLLALGSLSAVVAALDRWQLADPGTEIVAGASPDEAPSAEAVAVPLNRIPWIRAAVADRVVNPTDKITIDVIALLFDYIFRDASIPASLRELFERLQVPILKAALIDRAFFSDRKHPARRLLDHLAAAAIGATGDENYRAGFERVATGLIDELCREFRIDAAVFAVADAKLRDFVETGERKGAAVLGHDVAAALSAEQGEAERSEVRELIRDKLTGISVPFEVRGFAETIWADYLTLVRKRDGPQSALWTEGVRTLDDLLWSITAKERNAQKARLTKLVPGLVRNLRAGGAAVQVRDDRLQPFLEAVYRLHIAAIKPRAEPRTAATPEALAGSAGPAPGTAATAEPLARSAHPAPAATSTDARPGPVAISNVHDFVGEMVVGTWLRFDRDGKTVNARLSWVSPLRTKYIFTTRSRGQAIAVSPEELAWQLSEGAARLIVEPVPLFDRAVSSALDELAAQKSGAAAA
jgi:hypothetical protein